MISAPRPRVTAALGTVVVALALAVGSPVAAHAATEPDVLVSDDGVNFTTELQGALFDNTHLLIPGETIGASLWITNPAPTPALLRASAQDVDMPSAWAESVTMAVHDTGTNATRTAFVGSIAPCEVLVPARLLDPGETIRVDIRFALGDLSGTGGQNEQMHMNLTVAMRDGRTGTFPPSACEDRGVTVGVSEPAPAGRSIAAGGEIARTGGELAIGWPAFAAAAIGAGLFLVTGRRRDPQDDDDPATRVRR